MQLLEVIILKAGCVKMLLIEELLPCIGERKHCMVERTWILAHLGLNPSVNTFFLRVPLSA